jgi:hypothetical protein
MVPKNNSTDFEVNKVKIRFTSKEMTAYGGFSLLANFFNKIGLREQIETIFPITEVSSNRLGVYAKFIGFTLTGLVQVANARN